MKQLRLIACILSLSALALLFYGAFLPGSAAYARPSITISQPAHGTVVAGTVTIVVAYRSTTGDDVTHLEFWVDKQLAKAVKLNKPAAEGTYSFRWDTAALSTGLHSLTAIAYDAQNSFADVAVSVYKQSKPDSQPPAVGLDGLRDGQVVSGVTHLVANVLDSISSHLMVMFFVNNRLLAGTNVPPYRYSWDTTRVPNGPATLKVEAWDGSANLGQSPSVTVYVDNPGGRTLPGERPSTAVPPAAVAPPAPARPRLMPQSARASIPPEELAPAPLQSPETAAATPRPTPARRPELALTLGAPKLDQVAIAPAPGRVASFTPASPSGASGAERRLAEPGTRPVLSAGARQAGTQVAAAYPASAAAVFSPAGPRAAMPGSVSGRPRLSAPTAPAAGVAVVGPSSSPSAVDASPEIIAVTGTLAVPPTRDEARPATPSKPNVSAPLSQPGVLIAVVDRAKQRAVPLAVVVPRHSQPPDKRASMPEGVAPAPAVKRLVVTTPGKGTMTMVYNGSPVSFPDVKPFSREGMALAPFRRIFEHGGGAVLWNHLIKQVTASGDGRKVEFTIGKDEALINGKSVTLDLAPFIKDGRSIVPLSFVRDALDVTVEYDPASGKITIAAR
ncbi:MAG: hypothetical protein HY321_15020 [Armatimonadetes bacterium]|nr:hypothetical protein [Armatimonadota bacterium]